MWNHLDHGLTRREVMRLSAAGVAAPRCRAGSACSPSRAPSAAAPPGSGTNRASCCGWTAAQPHDTFDPKPGTADRRGEFKPIATSVPGIQISEHFPRSPSR